MKPLLLMLVVLAGCSSLVDDPCANGFQLVDGACVAGSDLDPGPDSDPTQPDGGIGALPDGGTHGGGDGGAGGGDGGSSGGDGGGGTDGGPTACEVPLVRCDGICIDVTADPDNCGGCGHVCGSGICTMGHCEGELSGHIVAIGHDYQSHHGSMARVLGNAVALAARTPIQVARYRGSASAAASNGTTAALAQSLAAIGRAWSSVELVGEMSIPADADVVLVEAQRGDPAAAFATGALYAPAIDSFLQRGGVVVVLEGHAGTSYELARGANLYTVAAPVPSLAEHAIVVNTADAVTQHVLSPYAAETSSVTFSEVADPVITTTSGGPLVFHRTRY